MWLANGQVANGFGYRQMVVVGKNFHPALDIRGKAGSPVRAAQSGVVKVSCWDTTGFGYTVDHSNSVESRYSHKSKLLVTAGQLVQAGQVLALMGQTDFATVVHVDFRVYVQDKEINPLTAL